MNLRTICRAVVLDQETAKILLVRNKGSDFWYPPGGGWEYESEDLIQCVVRETREEAGIDIHPVRLLYVQEFRPGNDDVHLELFWFAYPTGSTQVVVQDLHGIVEEGKWFSKEDLEFLTVYPKRLKSQFWHELSGILTSPSLFLK